LKKKKKKKKKFKNSQKISNFKQIKKNFKSTRIKKEEEFIFLYVKNSNFRYTCYLEVHSYEVIFMNINDTLKQLLDILFKKFFKT
jgi:hypothetical protein